MGLTVRRAWFVVQQISEVRTTKRGKVLVSFSEVLLQTPNEKEKKSSSDKQKVFFRDRM